MSRRSRRTGSDSGVSGAVVIDKPPGMTSHDVVDRVRRVFATRKVGHAGTLDPDATGVLVLGVGAGTKLLQFVTGADKSYEGELVLGVETTTLDAAGEVAHVHDMAVTEAEVSEAAATFVGDIEQVPPMVSAVKVGGKRLHELAREGKEIERAPRPVTVHRLAVSPTGDPLVYRLAVSCSSGTYIRSLAADIGQALGGGAHLRALRRTAVGDFTLAEARPLDTLDPDALRPVSDLVRHLPRLEVDDVTARRVASGQSLGASAGSGRLVVVDEGDQVLAVYEVRDGELRPMKVLVAV